MKNGIISLFTLAGVFMYPAPTFACDIKINAVAGVPLNYGDAATIKKVVSDARFTHFAVLYMKIIVMDSGAIKLKTKYAIFEGSGTKSDIDRRVVSLLNARFPKAGKPDGDWSGNQNLPVKRKDGNKTPVEHLSQSNFFVDRPMRLYVYFDNDTVSFSKVWPIIFTQYGSDDREKPFADWTSLDENCTFYNAERGGVVSLPASDQNQILYFENQYRDIKGELMDYVPENEEAPVANGKYSINFNIYLKQKNSNFLMPLSIDPDTGNGNGYPPPLIP